MEHWEAKKDLQVEKVDPNYTIILFYIFQWSNSICPELLAVVCSV